MEDEAHDEEMLVEPTCSNIAASWLEAWDNGSFNHSNFYKHWFHWAPKIYDPPINESCLNWQFNEDLAREYLFKPLEMFICRGDPTEVLEKLNHANQHPSVCGRFFKNGEPTYSCRECGMDKTCVLCVECFKNSTHRFHRYRMGASGGGGCCDCGDVEAWKKDPFCTLHQVQPTEDENGSNLPADLIERTRQVFTSILWYSFERLNTEEIADIRSEEFTELDENLFEIDHYCTILYNDEVHTFEQVINILGKVLKCNQRNSTEFVTNIDREGRAIAKCASFEVCSELKQEIEKYTSRHNNKPLKVLVTHAHIISHQLFAQKLLTWLEKILGHGKGFRTIFSECIQKPIHKNSISLLSQIMHADSALWKSARTQWHRLLIAGMLLEYEHKKALAVVFTKNYARIMEDFIRDDHEHSYSISSISVQLYTVPTLAHYLIANHDVLYILLNTLIAEYRPKCNRLGKLEFERNPTMNFKRSLFMLFDFKYLLTYVPDVWTDDLRKCFLHGFSMLIQLLIMMQGMDSVTRQVGQHMEFEPEWESGFNLHIKLATCISQVIQWCATDRVVLIKAYRLLLRSLEENPCYEPNQAGEVRELADHSTACLHYDVSTKPVSIHLPLTRLFAALHLNLDKFLLHFDSFELQRPKPTPVQIIEPVLRTQVMIAQVHAGMWRRNGYALLNTLYFYHNVKCRSEMLDRDVTLLQTGASLIESNEFLIHILNKFNLINWALPDFEINTLKSPEEDSMRQTINLVEEFLYLLIVIIGERHMPGVSRVTNKDRIKKDLLHALCIKPAPHSELVKCVADDLETEDGILDEVIHEIAKFKEPLKCSNAKGTYELLPELFDEFNVFFYHYTREEMSKGEENQRKRRKDKGEIECCPPPKLPHLCESFTMLVNLLHCDVMLHVIQTVFERCLNLRARSFSENQLHKTLHIVGYGLQEEESGNYPFLKFVEHANKFRIFELMEELLKCPRVDAHKGLLQWTLKKYQQVAKKELNNADIHKDPSTSAEVDVTEKERRAKLAAERRAKLMAQMAAQQKNFIKENAKHFENNSMNVQSETLSESSCDMEVVEIETIALGPNKSQSVLAEKTYTCILCQEEEKITVDGPTMVLAAFVQQSTVLNNAQDHTCKHIDHNLLCLSSKLCPAPYTSTCGHVMHSECWRKYFDNVMIREHRRPYRLRHPSSFDVDKQEFLCPLCECLSNTVLPIVPSLSKLRSSKPECDLPFGDFLSSIKYIIEKKNKVCHGIFKCQADCRNIHCSACSDASNGDTMNECDVNLILLPYQVFYSTMVNRFDETLNQNFKNIFPGYGTELNPQLHQMIQVFGQVTYNTRRRNVPPHPYDKELAPSAWKSLAHTIHAIETVTKYQGKALLGSLTSRQRDSLENLVKVACVLGSTLSKIEVIKSHALNLLSILFDASGYEENILVSDSFGFLVSLTFSLPSLLPQEMIIPIASTGTLEWHSLRLIFILEIMKILLESQIVEFEEPGSDTSNNNEVLARLLLLVGKAGLKPGYKINEVKLWEYVKECSKQFLRCCVLFYHYLSEVPAPICLQEVGGDTFENMCAYLDLPKELSELFDSEIIYEIVEKWILNDHVRSYSNHISAVCSPLSKYQTPRLVELPVDYSDLINAVSTFSCPNSEEECRNPTMCLVCGQVLCSQSYCCQAEHNKIAVGACNNHAAHCGTGIGVFLRIRDCELLLLASPQRGCFMSPPYLDEHGETDQGLRRGNPLKLNPERYEKLNMMWLNHSVHEEIARQIETGNHYITTQWNML